MDQPGRDSHAQLPVHSFASVSRQSGCRVPQFGLQPGRRMLDGGLAYPPLESRHSFAFVLPGYLKSTDAHWVELFGRATEPSASAAHDRCAVPEAVLESGRPTRFLDMRHTAGGLGMEWFRVPPRPC